MPPVGELWGRLERDERLHQFSHALKNRLGSLWQAASMLHDLPEGPERHQLLAMAEKNYFMAPHDGAYGCRGRTHRV